MDRIVAILVLLLAVPLGWAAPAADAGSQVATLRAKHDELKPRLDKSAFGRPLVLLSNEGDRSLKGDVFAVVDYSFEKVQSGLTESQAWCDILILPFNTKHCHAASDRLAVRIGRKASQNAESAYPIDFKYDVVAKTPEYFRINLKADNGPLGTQNYRIELEAVPVDDKRTLIHLGYSYGFSTISRLAMQAYLNTAGANKVGFTQTGRDEQGQPVLVGGMLGATERNTMRYFLAIDSFLGSLATAPEARVEKRLNDWFTAISKYPKQLHEMDKGEYLAMKRREIARSREQIG